VNELIEIILQNFILFFPLLDSLFITAFPDLSDGTSFNCCCCCCFVVVAVVVVHENENENEEKWNRKEAEPRFGHIFSSPIFLYDFFSRFIYYFIALALKYSSLSLSLSLSLLIHVPLIKGCVKIRGHMCKQLALFSPV
jgi:hypothetical protein